MVVLLSLVVTALSVWYTATRMGFLPDRSDLINPDLTWNAAYHRYKQAFPRWDDLIVVIDPGDPAAADGSQAPHDRPPTTTQDAARAFVQALAARLEAEPGVRQVLAGYVLSPDNVRTLLGRSDAEFAAAWAELQQSQAALAAASLADLIDTSLAGLGRELAATATAAGPIAPAPAVSAGAGLASETTPSPTPAPASAQLRMLADLLSRSRLVAESAESTPSDEVGPSNQQGSTGHLPRILDGPLPGDWMPLRSDTGRLLLMMVDLEDTGDGLDRTAAGLAAVRSHVRDLLTMPAYAGIEAGVTGIAAIESDETTQSIADSTLASIVALVLIAVLMVVVFRGVIVPLCALLALLTGVAWSFGFLTLAVGHLQILSVVFTVILLGLGIDFALHILSRLELIRDDHETLEHAIDRVYRRVGPGMITGAITTAAAFGIMAFSDFRGVAEMGIIAGGGILLCLVAMLSVFPALLALLPNWRRAIRFRPGGEEAHFLHDHLNWVDKKPHGTLAVAGGLTLLAAAGAMSMVRYDQDLLNLHPPGVESVQWEKRLLEEGARSVWAGLSIADSLTEARERTLAFAAREDQVSSVDGVGLLFHPDRASRQEIIRQAYSTVASGDDTALMANGTSGNAVADPAAGSAADQAARLTARLRQLLAGLRLAGYHPSTTPAVPGAAAAVGSDVAAATALATAADRLLAMLAVDPAGRWARVEQAFARDRADLDAAWRALVDPRPAALVDLPDPIRALNIGVDGSLLLRVNPADDPRSILDPDRLGPFVEAMRAVDPGIIGPPVQIHESSRLIVRAYVQAAWVAVVVIALLLWLDFRSLADTACAMLPVAIGFVGMFAIMGLAGVPVNFANIIVMPLIFGIGVDAGVHIVHRWRLEPEGIPKGLSGGTGRGITLTMITTIIGFACLMLAHHRGIRGLGFTMTAGLVVTLAACYTALPAALALRSRGRSVDYGAGASVATVTESSGPG